jgi:leukotriene-A4 hydrolase
VFLDNLEAYAPYTPRAITTLDETYGIHKTDNAEIRLRFYRVALKSGKEYAEDAAGA